MKRIKIITLICCIILLGCLIMSCKGGKEEGSIYFLNFKPESEEAWVEIAKTYTEETGIEMKVVTAASGTYESTLKAEIDGDNPPTLFQVNGPIGYQAWKEYTLDLTDSALYQNLSESSMAITGEDGGVYAIPYVVEGYGIIYNDAILQTYFALPTKGTNVSSAGEIKDFDTLSAVVQDMTAHKDEIGIEGVFSSTSFAAGEDWRWQTHLANLPIYFEYKAAGVDDMAEIDFSYNQNYKNIFDLYLQNSISSPTTLGSITVNDSMEEFALGKTCMVQNGNWGWGQISEVEGNVVDETHIKFLPIYTGTADDSSQGLCIGTENFFAVNAKATEASQQATLDFVEWLITSESGKKSVTDKLGFIVPFSSFSSEEQPADPLAQEVARAMNDESTDSVPWVFVTFPSQNFKDNFGADLLQYAAGELEWEEVAANVVESWKVEKQAVAEQ